jgi:hypothetical protein
MPIFYSFTRRLAVSDPKWLHDIIVGWLDEHVYWGQHAFIQLVLAVHDQHLALGEFKSLSMQRPHLHEAVQSHHSSFQERL